MQIDPHSSWYARFAAAIIRHPTAVLVAWILVAVVLRWAAPAWDDVTHDGDLAFLPSRMSTVRGERLTEISFSPDRPKSQVAIMVARQNAELEGDDLRFADRLAATFIAHQAESLLAEALTETDPLKRDQRLGAALEAAQQANSLHEQNAQLLALRARIWEQLGEPEQASQDRQALDHAPPLAAVGGATATTFRLPLHAVWTRHTEVFGDKLRSRDRCAQLIVLQLRTEFMAVENMQVLELVERRIAELRPEAAQRGLTIAMSGSAVVGGDMLRSAAESIQNTEAVTVLLVLLILLVVYRAPLLVAVPLLTIAASLIVSTSLLAWLTQLNLLPGFSWWGFKLFTTTKIFVVVILFGAGTDFCLFLIARYREHLAAGQHATEGLTNALVGVGDALIASALTTVLGLAMMFFAEFGKFRSSGPAIGLCLLITLLACLTFTPALLCRLGPHVYWPFRPWAAVQDARACGQRSPIRREPARWWVGVSQLAVRHPVWTLLLTTGILLPGAWHGWFVADDITFNLLNELDRDRGSYRGAEALRRHFPVGESGPLALLIHQPGADFESDDPRTKAEAKGAIFDLTVALSQLPGVQAVRSLAEPLGEPPRRASPVSAEGRKKLVMQQHAQTRAIFIGQNGPYHGDVTRLELVLRDDPFSREAEATLRRVRDFLTHFTRGEPGFWSQAEFFFTGTTAAIGDLREVLQSDRRRIQVLVVLAVWAVLVTILRRPLTCVYLMASVLFSYYVTMGVANGFFAAYYGDSFQGFDWKVPIFLFVILVAVGQDYNIYLVTRIFEEQARRGPFAGLREAVLRTGGIITSCGAIMAGTFVSMMSGTLRGIVELGFALSFGILLDTLVVRTLLVPAWFALMTRQRLSRT